jgi:hypothetical protein
LLKLKDVKMHDLPRQKLCELILEYGRSLCDDPRRCEALLKDYCGEHKREIFVLVNALKNGIASDLLKAQSNGVPETMSLSKVRQRLEDDLAMTAEASQWAVESWTLALGLIVKPTPVAPRVQPTPSTPSPPASGVNHTLLSGRYRDHGDGTVTDVKTGLQWMRCSFGQEWKVGSCTGKAIKCTWSAAHQVVDALNRQGGYAGYRDWRLPTKAELQTLIYCSSSKPQSWNDTGQPCKGSFKSPTIDYVTFPNTPCSYVWSDSLCAGNSSSVWYVYFGDGYVGNSGQSYSSVYVRLVRSGQ